jgi:two-component system, response regulator RegA
VAGGTSRGIEHSAPARTTACVGAFEPANLKDTAPASRDPETAKQNSELLRLLLVDDDPVFSSVLAKALRKRGYKVSVARDCESAVATAGREPPECVVMDLRLPDGSGLSLIKVLLALDPRMRVVMLTGYASIATAIEAVKLGAFYYLAKPCNVEDIVAALSRDREASCTPVCEKPLSVHRLEWEYINRVLRGNNGNVTATARELRMDRRTLQRKLNKHPVRE